MESEEPIYVCLEDKSLQKPTCTVEPSTAIYSEAFSSTKVLRTVDDHYDDAVSAIRVMPNVNDVTRIDQQLESSSNPDQKNNITAEARTMLNHPQPVSPNLINADNASYPALPHRTANNKRIPVLTAALAFARDHKTKIGMTIAFAAIVGLLSGVIVLVLQLSTCNRHQKTNVTTEAPELCTSEDCLHLAKDMFKLMNTTVDPCNDFYAFACGNWTSHARSNWTNKRGLYGTFEMVSDDIAAISEGTLRILPHDPQKTKSDRVALFVYDSCILYQNNSNSQKSENVKAFQEKFMSGREWPLTEKDASKFQITKELVKTLAELAIPVLFNVHVAPSIKKKDKHSVYLTAPPFDPLMTPETFNDRTTDIYLGCIKTSVCLFATNPVQCKVHFPIDILARKIMEMEILISKNQRKAFLESQHLSEVPVGHLSNTQVHESDPDENWWSMILSILEHVFGIKKYDDIINVFWNENYTLYTFEELENYTARDLGNFLTWKIVQHYGPYFFEEIMSCQGKVLQQHLGVDKGWTPREKCFFVTNQVLRYFDLTGIAIANAEEEPLPGILKNVSLSVNELVMRAEWMDKRSQAVAIQKVLLLKDFFMRKRFELVDPDNTVYDYILLRLNKSDFVEVLKTVVEKTFTLSKQEKFRNDVTIALNPLHADLVYFEESNSLVVPVGALHKRLFSREAPRSILFGTFGVRQAYHMSHMFFNKGSHYDQENQQNDWWTKDTRANYLEKRKCFSLRNIEMDNLSSRRLDEDIAYAWALQTAYRAYKYVSSYKNPQLPKEMEKYTPEQLFFISFGQVMCTTYTDKMKTIAYQYDSRRLRNERVIQSLQNSEEFSGAFECPDDSNMNSKIKCRVW